MSQRVVLVACTALLLTAAAPLAAAEHCSLFEGSAVLASNSAHVNRSATVAGDVVVAQPSPGPYLVSGFQLNIDRFANIGADGSPRIVAADSIKVNRNAKVWGDAFVNQLENLGMITGSVSPFTPSTLPAFVEAVVRTEPPQPHAPGLGEDVNVLVGSPVTLAPGDYGHITVGAGGSLTFGGGVFNVRSVTAGAASQVLFAAATDIRVAGRWDSGIGSTVGPAGPGVTAGEIVIYIGGANGGNGSPGALPTAFQIGKNSDLDANVYAARGTVLIDKDTDVSGALVGRDVRIDTGVELTLDSFFVNQAPVADAQTVVTVGAVPVEITVTGSDPEGDDLSFSIDIGPDEDVGTLSGLTPVVPNDGVCSISRTACTAVPGGECPGGEVCEFPAVTSATVTYTPETADNESNSFVFKVTDECGKTSTATVEINPNDDGEAPPVEAVTALDLEVGVAVDSSTKITLDAGSPESVAGLTYRIESLPATGTLKDSGGVPIPSAPFELGDQVVIYAAPSTTGAASFTYSARDSATGIPPCGSPSCDSAVVDITINQPYPLAEDVSVETPLNTPVQFTLKANPGGAGSGGGGGGAQIASRSSASATTSFYRAQPIGSGEGNGTRTRRTTAFGSAGSSGGAATNQGTFALTFDAGWSPTTAVPPAFFWGGTIPVFADETFTFTGPGCLSVTDDFQKGDQFRVYDNGSPIFTTPAVAVEASASQVGPQAAYVDPTYGSATFVVGAGSHSITIEVIGKSFSSGRGYIRVDTECEPNLEVTSFRAPATAVLDTAIGDQIFATVTNTGFAAIPAGTSFPVGFYISTDSTITTGDRLLSGGRENFLSQVPGGLAVGQQWQVDLFDGASISSTFPDTSPPTGNVFIGFLADEFDDLVETDETDNTASSEIDVQATSQALSFSIQTLPSFGLLTTQSGAAVSVGQTFSVAPILVYTPNFNSSSPDSFQYQVTEGPLSALAVVEILVSAFDNCAAQGRPPGCAPGGGGGGGGEAAASSSRRWFESLITGPVLTVQVTGEGDVATSRRQVLGYDLPGLACSTRCSGRYQEGQEVLVYARPVSADSVFVSWGGDCSGTDAVALVTLDRARHCVAVFESRPME